MSGPNVLNTFQSLANRELLGKGKVLFSELLAERKSLEDYLETRYKKSFSDKDPSSSRILELLFLEVMPTKIYKSYLRVCFLAVRKCVSDSFDYLLPDKPTGPTDEAKVAYFQKLFHELLIFLNVFELQENPNFEGYRVGRRNVAMSNELFSSAYHHAFNFFNSKTIASIVTQPIAVFLIRQAIEVRIKNCLGIHLIRYRSNYQTVRITPDQFIDFVYSKKDKIFLPIKKSELKRVHGWTNLFVHSGFMPEMYKIWYAMKTVEPLFASGSHDGYWHVHGSIKIDKEYFEKTLDTDVKTFVAKKYSKSGLKTDDLVIEKMDPEAILV